MQPLWLGSQFSVLAGVYAIIAPKAEPQWGGALCVALGPREEFKLCTPEHMC